MIRSFSVVEEEASADYPGGYRLRLRFADKQLSEPVFAYFIPEDSPREAAAKMFRDLADVIGGEVSLHQNSNLEQVANELIAEAQITGKNMYWANRFAVVIQREKTAKAIANFGETIKKLQPIQSRQNG